MTTPEASWVDTADAFAAVVDALAAEPVWGFDTEFHRERTYYPQLALLQVAWPGGLALVDPLAVDIAPLARALVTDATVVVHAADQDLDVVQRACGVLPTRLFDTQVVAGFAGFSSPALALLLERLLGERPAKADRLTDWLQRPLDDAQRAYAAADVAHLLDLHRILTERLTASGRLDWALDECETVRLRARGGADPDTAWWRIKDARSLRGRARGIAQALAAWRERTAMETDQPVRWVLPDLAVIAIAQRPPKSVEELRTMRGVDGRALRNGAGRRILEAVEAGLALHPDQLNVPPTEDDLERSMRPALTILSAWASQQAGDHGLDPTLLATRADLLAYLRGDPDGRLAKGWRRQLLGAPLDRILSGEVALAFERRTGLVMVPRGDRPATP